MIVNMLSANDDEIVCIIINLGQFVTYQEIAKVYWYLLEVDNRGHGSSLEYQRGVFLRSFIIKFQ